MNRQNNADLILITMASNAKKIKTNPFMSLRSEAKLFSNPGKISSKLTLKKALSILSELGKAIDLVGKGNESDMYDPESLLNSIGRNFKNLSCILHKNHIIIDFKDIKSNRDTPIGVRVFNISDYKIDDDMVRRSKN